MFIFQHSNEKDAQEAQRIISDYFSDNLLVKREMQNFSMTADDKEVLVNALRTAFKNRMDANKRFLSKDLKQLCAYAAMAVTCNLLSAETQAGQGRMNLETIADIIKTYPNKTVKQIHAEILVFLRHKKNLEVREISIKELSNSIATDKDEFLKHKV